MPIAMTLTDRELAMILAGLDQVRFTDASAEHAALLAKLHRALKRKNLDSYSRAVESGVFEAIAR